MDKQKSKLQVKELTLFAMLGALTFGAKVAMMGLPNIEPVSLMVMLFAVTFGRKALYPIYTYVVLEICLYGIHMWSLNYLYVWLILAIAAWALRRMQNPLGWGLLCGAYGLLFGLFCSPVYALTGGPAFAVSWWISGIPFDLLHGAGNFVMGLTLFMPMRKLLDRLYRNDSRDAAKSCVSLKYKKF